MLNFHRLSKYVIAYLILLTVSAFVSAGGILRPVDLFIYKKFYLNSDADKYIQEIKENIIFVDIPTQNFAKDSLIKELREHTAGLLHTIDGMVPEPMDPPIVIVDMTYTSASDGIDTLKGAIKKLTDREFKVYAGYELPGEKDPVSFDDHDQFQNKILYNYFFSGGRLNVTYHNHEKVKGLITYNSFELIDKEAIESLPLKVVSDLDPTREETDLIEQKQYELPLKLPFQQDFRKDIYFTYSDGPPLPNSEDFSEQRSSFKLSNKFIIIGTPKDTLQVGKNSVPGPFIMASAIIDQINDNTLTKRAHDSIAVQIAFVILFAFFVCGIFALIYKYIKQIKTRPSIIAVIAFLLGIILLTGLGYVLLLESTIIRPALPMLSMLWAAVLSWHFAKKFLVTGIMDGGNLYDVFISYSHGDSIWVKRNLFTPLSEITKPEGGRLKIFFDEKSIGIGELFTTKYMRGIVDSKLFIPVMSQEYYNKNHCRNEMDLAVKRHVEKKMNLCILALDYEYVPEEFRNINFVDINQNGNFISRIKQEVVKDHVDQENIALESDTEIRPEAEVQPIVKLSEESGNSDKIKAKKSKTKSVKNEKKKKKKLKKLKPDKPSQKEKKSKKRKKKLKKEPTAGKKKKKKKELIKKKTKNKNSKSTSKKRDKSDKKKARVRKRSHDS
ncbi:MAG: toll/interleukin-1 receptor domain-containing protein [Maribacter sp.]|nr:toll/interleukin-1 receptor domain-containing protein [Maribacter sp.]